jgi:FixJ family two-component response regulator
MKLGADDFLPKMPDTVELLEAVERALARSANKFKADEDLKQIREYAESLTAREREVCQRVIGVMLNKQIASKLGIAERTVKAHRSKVMEKFGVQSLPDLVRIAEKAGISLSD